VSEAEMSMLRQEAFELAESPRYVDGGLLFTDIDRGILYRWRQQQLEKLWDREQITSFLPDRSGGLVVGTMHGLYSLMPDGAFSALTKQTPLKINDMCADPQGRVVFGTNYHTDGQRYPLGSLFVYDRDGLRELDYGYHLANGIGFSPDGRQLYVCDSAVRTVFVYPYDPRVGACGRKRILIRFRMDDGMPDGMAVDREGGIWTAQWYGGCVICTAPNGAELRRVPVPGAQVSAVEFSPEGLYITTAHEYGRLDIAPHGFSPDAPGIGGGVFLVDPGVSGSPHAQADVLRI
jgi:sugar lactone lactonase YvrE